MYNSLKTELFKKGEKRLKKIIEAINSNDREKFLKNLYNVFEKIAFKRYPILREIKRELLNFGADASLMSGSGSTIYAIFFDNKKAYYAFEYMKSIYKNTILCEPLKNGVEIIDIEN